MNPRRFQLGLGASAIILLATSANAQDADDDKRELEEILVTAQKIEQTAQSVSRSINVVSDTEIADIGATDLQQVMDTLPGFGLAGFQNQPALRGIGNDLIDPNSPGGAPPVVVNVDGAGAGGGTNSGGTRGLGQNGFSASLFDVERIEVMMGPSGTMQGQNALAGSINVITRNPVLEEWNFNVGAQYGNYNQQVVNFGANIPMGDTVAMRLAYQKQEHDPYNSTLCVTDIVLGPPGTPPMCTAGQKTETNAAQDITQARAKILWQPSDTFRAVVSVQYDQDNSDLLIVGSPEWKDPWQFRIGDPAAVAAGDAVLFGPLIVFPYNDGPTNMRYTGEIEWDMGWATLTNITSMSTAKINNCPAGQTCNDDKRLSNELRFQNVTDSGFEWIVGFYFDKFELKSLGCTSPGGDCTDDDVLGVPAPSININQAALLANAVERGLANPAMMASVNTAGARDTQSAYASIVWPLSDTQRLRAGLRFAKDNSGDKPLGFITGTTLPDNDISLARFEWEYPANSGTIYTDMTYDEAVAFNATLGGNPVPGEVCTNCDMAFADGPYSFSGESSPFNWNLVWEWDFADDSMMYAGLNTGYKAGGVQQLKIPSQTFPPQEVLQWSLGFKTRVRDNTVQWNTELYYYDFTNYQLQVNNYAETAVEVDGATYTIPHIGNAIGGDYGIVWPDPQTQGESNNNVGFQTELVTVPNQFFIGLESTVTALVTNNDPVSANVTLANRRFGNVIGNSGINLAGTQVANSPEVAGYVTYEHFFNDFLGGTLTPKFTARYTGDTPVSNELTAEGGVYLPKQFQDAYWKYDANVSWNSNDGHWRVNLYGNNLSNSAENRGAPPFDATFIPVPFLHGTISPPRTYGLKVDYFYN